MFTFPIKIPGCELGPPEALEAQDKELCTSDFLKDVFSGETCKAEGSEKRPRCGFRGGPASA